MITTSAESRAQVMIIKSEPKPFVCIEQQQEPTPAAVSGMLSLRTSPFLEFGLPTVDAVGGVVVAVAERVASLVDGAVVDPKKLESLFSNLAVVAVFLQDSENADLITKQALHTAVIHWESLPQIVQAAIDEQLNAHELFGVALDDLFELNAAIRMMPKLVASLPYTPELLLAARLNQLGNGSDAQAQVVALTNKTIEALEYSSDESDQAHTGPVEGSYNFND